MESQWHLLSIATKFILASNFVREPQGFKLEEMAHIFILILVLLTDTYVRLRLQFGGNQNPTIFPIVWHQVCHGVQLGWEAAALNVFRTTFDLLASYHVCGSIAAILSRTPALTGRQ